MEGNKQAIKIKDLKDYYLSQSKKERRVWIDCYKNYRSYANPLLNPYLSNLFIPKTHEAVELLAAFLIGRNQVIDVSPEGEDDDESARYMQKLLDYQWRKELYARPTLLVWLKQAILFGNGVLKLGWDMENNKDRPFMTALGMDTVFMDYYTPNIQDAPLIHRIVRPITLIGKDKRYKIKGTITPLSESEIEEPDTKFSAYDNTNITTNVGDKELKTECAEILEMWDPFENKIITALETSLGYQVIREVENKLEDSDKNPYLPFVKLKFKNNPLPNRAYDIGAIENTIEIQKAFNKGANQFFDNASLVNDKMWIKRKTANIDPKTMQRRPGGIIEVNDINADIRAEETGDIKQSLIEMLRFLDDEYQQASMVVNLLKGVSDSGTATEAALGQQNTQTLLDMIDGNIKDAMSQAGQMLADLNIQFQTKEKTIKIFENDRQMGFARIKPKDIKGKYDVKIAADRAATEGKAIRQKQLLDFLAIISRDQVLLQKYPDLPAKIYKKWLENAGFSDLEYFFEEAKNDQSINGQEGDLAEVLANLPKEDQGGNRQFNSRGAGLTNKGQNKMVSYTDGSKI